MSWFPFATAAPPGSALLAAAAAVLPAAPKGPPHDPGYCLLIKAETQVRTLLRTEPGSTDERAAVQALQRAATACGRMAAPAVDEAGAQFRGGIARAYFRRRLPGLSVGPNSNPNFSANLFVVERGYDEAGAMQRPYRLAHCIVSVNLNGGSRVAHAAAGSAAEGEALAALRPSLASCLDAGQHLSLRPNVLRDALAIVLAQQFSFPFNAAARRH
jgi:hypothetical protein